MNVSTESSREALTAYVENAVSELDTVRTADQLVQWRHQHIGRSSEIARFRQSIGNLDPAERPEFGRLVNEAARTLADAFERQSATVQAAEKLTSLAKEAVDVTLPPRDYASGHRHARRGHRCLRQDGVLSLRNTACRTR